MATTSTSRAPKKRTPKPKATTDPGIAQELELLRNELASLKAEFYDVRETAEKPLGEAIKLSQDVFTETVEDPHGTDEEVAEVSAEEMSALLEATASLATVTQTVERPAEEPVPTKQIVSAAEIQAMLGLKDVTKDSPPEAVGTTLDLNQSLDEVSTELPEDSAEFQSQAPEVPVEQIDLTTVDPLAVAKVSGSCAASALAVPVCEINGKLHCLAVEPFDMKGLEAMSKASGLEVVAHSADIKRVLTEIRSRYSSQDDPLVWEERVEATKSLLEKFRRKEA